MTAYPDIRLRKYSKSNGKVNWFELAEDCCVVYNNSTVVIPAGYRTDFASVPRWLWSFIPPHGKMANASVVHDYAYDNRICEAEHGPDAARLLADITFLWHCRLDGVPTWQAIVFFLTLRAFGRKLWDN